MLQELRRSELLQVGSVYVHRNDLLESTACWVLHSSAVGSLVVDVKIVPVGSKWLGQWPVDGDENLRIVHVTAFGAFGDWFGLLSLGASPRDCFDAVGSHKFDACVSLECLTNTPHPILEFRARNAFRGLTKSCMSTIMVSEGYTWVGRKPTLELEILAFLIPELVEDDEVQRLLEKKAHELQSMITTESKKLLEDAVGFDQARAPEQVVVVAPKLKTTAQCTPRGVPRAPPEARDVPEPTPTGSASASGQQLAAISWQRGKRSRRITWPVQPRGLRGSGTVRCVKSSGWSSRGRRPRFTYRLAETFRLSSVVGRFGKSSTPRSLRRREVAVLHGLQCEVT